MKKIIIIAITALLLTSGTSYSQMGGQFLKNGLFTVGYNMAFSTGSLHDWNAANSFRGGDFEYLQFVNSSHKIAIGGHVGWQGFYKEYPKETYIFPSGALTAIIYKYYYTIPMHGVASYFFNPDGFVQPYASLMVGVNYNERSVQVGQYYITDKSWNFSFAPEVGILVPFGELSDWAFNLKASYLYNVYSRDGYKGYGEMSGLAYINVLTGLTYSF
jgi:hypothetical protein